MKFTINKSQCCSFIKYLLLLNIGLIFTAAGIALFKSTNNFVFGGTSGIAIIITSFFPKLNVGYSMWIVNAVLVALALIFLELKSSLWTIYASFALSLYVTVFQKIIPLNHPMTDDLFLEFCFATILPAVGSAIVFNIGASTGGTDIVAMILSKYTSLEIGKALLASDISIVIIAFFIYGEKTGLYCILGLTLKCTILDTAIESLNLRKVCTVISSHPDEIKEYIVNKLHRTATEQQAFGAYRHDERCVLMTVLTRRGAASLRKHIKNVDPYAFITIVNSSEIIGKGFRSL